GGHDVPSARASYRACIASAVHHLTELLDLLPVGTFERRAWPRIERDEIYLGGNADEQPHELLGVRDGIVDTLQHDIFERDALGVGKAWIGAAGVEQLLDRPFLVDGHELVAKLVAHRVQRNGKHGASLLAPARNLRHHARGRQRNAALRDGKAIAVGGNRHRVPNIVEIVERLAHAHEHDISDLAFCVGNAAWVFGVSAWPIAEPVACDHDLADDFGRGQIAHEFLRARVAEAAGERAADLARNAQSAAILFRDVDRLDLL